MDYKSVTFSRLPGDLRKISAIKGVRAFTGWGLKDSKELVDDLHNGNRNIILKFDLSAEAVTSGNEYLHDSGIKAHLITTNNKVRNAIGRQIEGTATWSTIAGQYDLAKEMISLLETYFPDGIKPDTELEDADND